ncbi:ankyrin [Flavobacterium psychrophilum]|nr:ankyrin [Flavobacterium psychrophilum]AOE53133.1 ankyrin [Flavobacterium psychrophilum]
MKKLFSLLLLCSALCSAQQKAKDVFDVARSGTVEEMKALVQIKKDTVNSVNAHGYSTLILACYRGNKPVAEYLASKVDNINYNSSSGTALAAAAIKGDVATVKILLENKANPDLADANGMTPLMFASQFDNKELLLLLLKYKANATVANSEGKSAMDYAVHNKNQEIINLLKSK